MATRVLMSERAKQVLGKWYDESLLEDTPIFRGSFFGLLFGLSGQTAVTLNRKVHLTRKAADAESDLGIMLLGHEFFHVEQQRVMGWGKYLLRYILLWRPWHIWAGHTHPMEVDAYKRGSEVWLELHRRPSQ